MKKYLPVIFVVLSLFIAKPIRSLSTKGVIELKPIKKEVIAVLETLTVYNPTAKQCDNSPLVTASNNRIDEDKLFRQEIKWMAVSRDLLKKWNGEFSYGDTVMLTSGDKAIDGLWVIHDNMNKRYTNRGDLLFDSRIRTLGKWEDVTISKRVSYESL
jgi:hypothetical protein